MEVDAIGHFHDRFVILDTTVGTKKVSILLGSFQRVAKVARGDAE